MTKLTVMVGLMLVSLMVAGAFPVLAAEPVKAPAVKAPAVAAAVAPPVVPAVGVLSRPVEQGATAADPVKYAAPFGFQDKDRMISAESPGGGGSTD